MMNNFRHLTGEFFGTAILTATLLGSGVTASQLSKDALLAVLAMAFATTLAFGVMILILQPISGAHFNPFVSLILLIDERGKGSKCALCALAQIIGAIVGAILVNLMFGRQILEIARTERLDLGTALGEVVATAGLIFVIVALIRVRKERLIALAVPAWIGTAFFMTSSTAFANPAITIGRIFSDSFAGVEPASAVGFIAAQFIGALLGYGLSNYLFEKKHDLAL